MALAIRAFPSPMTASCGGNWLLGLLIYLVVVMGPASIVVATESTLAVFPSDRQRTRHSSLRGGSTTFMTQSHDTQGVGGPDSYHNLLHRDEDRSLHKVGKVSHLDGRWLENDGGGGNGGGGGGGNGGGNHSHHDSSSTTSPVPEPKGEHSGTEHSHTNTTEKGKDEPGPASPPSSSPPSTSPPSSSTNMIQRPASSATSAPTPESTMATTEPPETAKPKPDQKEKDPVGPAKVDTDHQPDGEGGKDLESSKEPVDKEAEITEFVGTENGGNETTQEANSSTKIQGGEEEADVKEKTKEPQVGVDNSEPGPTESPTKEKEGSEFPSEKTLDSEPTNNETNSEDSGSTTKDAAGGQVEGEGGNDEDNVASWNEEDTKSMAPETGSSASMKTSENGVAEEEQVVWEQEEEVSPKEEEEVSVEQKEGTQNPDDKATYHPTDDDPIKKEDVEQEEMELEQELQQEEKVARRAGGFGIFLGVVAMIFTAHQMSENPDGIYASVCRLAITISSVVVKIVCMPCRKLLGAGNPHYNGHMPISTSGDYGYRSDPYRSSANAGFELS